LNIVGAVYFFRVCPCRRCQAIGAPQRQEEHFTCTPALDTIIAPLGIWTWLQGAPGCRAGDREDCTLPTVVRRKTRLLEKGLTTQSPTEIGGREYA